jgi:hypothetical protein
LSKTIRCQSFDASRDRYFSDIAKALSDRKIFKIEKQITNDFEMAIPIRNGNRLQIRPRQCERLQLAEFGWKADRQQ